MDQSPSGRSSRHQPASLDLLYCRVDYERRPPAAGELNLDRMGALLQRLANPHHALRAVHITGTKGKGSTAAMVAGVLSAAGYKTGLFTSPHLQRFEERIAIDGHPCSEADVLELIEHVRPAVMAMDAAGASPTFFEVLTAMAMVQFHRQAVDCAVLEVGLGGRFDSTNVCLPVVTAITSISLDHTQQLGPTCAAIAWEKAGIIKPGVPVVSGVTDVAAQAVIAETAAAQRAPLFTLGRDFDYDYRPGRATARNIEWPRVTVRIRNKAMPTTSGELTLPLFGRHQAANVAVAITIVEELRRGGWKIAEPSVQIGLSRLRWPARIELVARRPLVVIDSAHNVASIEALVETLSESFAARPRVAVFGTSSDKDAAGMLRRLLPAFDETIVTQYANNPRATPAGSLGEIGGRLADRPLRAYNASGDAVDAALASAGPNGLVCVTGSFYLAAELRPRFVAD